MGLYYAIDLSYSISQTGSRSGIAASLPAWGSAASVQMLAEEETDSERSDLLEAAQQVPGKAGARL